MQALARGKNAYGQTWRQPAGAFPGGEITLLVIIGGFLLAETAQSGDSRFLIVGKKVGIKSLLRIADLRQRRWRQGAVTTYRRCGHALRQRLAQSTEKGIFKGRKHLIHFVIPGQHAAWGQ